MSKRMLIDSVRPEETRVVILGDNNRIEEFDFITSAKSQVKGNIYLAKVTRVEPSLQAAFIEYGGDKQGFLSFSEIHPDYYQIPIADRKRLLEEMERAEREEAEREARRDREEEQRRARGEQAGEEDDEGDGEEGRQDERPRGGRRRSRRRTFGARHRDEKASEMVTQSEALADDLETAGNPEATDAPDAVPQIVAHAHFGEPAALESTALETIAPDVAAAEDTADRVDTLDAEPDASDAAPTSLPAEIDAEPAETPNTLDTNSDEETIERARKTAFSKRYRIQEVIKRGQIVLVQVIKEERGNKGVSLTTYISLAGRYCVLMPNASKDGGISRKVGKNDERKRLREIASELRDSCGMSVIIRTAGLGRTKVEVKRDHEYLVNLWNKIREDALSSTAPALIYEESDILKRSIRDYYEPEIEEILVQGEEAHKNAKEFMKLIMPSHAPRVKQYKEETPILSDFRVESQLEEMYQPVAKLRSGGYIVINHTEALIAIDVNSGRSTSERNVEETALKTNLEAAREVARQLRLRDLGGLIVVDFIDMFYGKNRRAVERAFKDALRADRAKIQVGHISPFGLLELSRQRMRPSISETTTLSCPHCQGTGHIRSNESMAIEIVRALEREASSGQFRELRVTVSTETALHMLNNARRYLNEIEERFGVSVLIKSDHAYLSSQYSMEKIRRAGDAPRPARYEHDRNKTARPRGMEPESADDDATEETPRESSQAETGGDAAQPRRRRSRGGRGRNRHRDHHERNTQAASDVTADTPSAEAPTSGDSAAYPATPAEAQPESPEPVAAETVAAEPTDAAEGAAKKPAARRKPAPRAKSTRATATDKAPDATEAPEASSEPTTPRRKPASSARKPATRQEAAAAPAAPEEPAPAGPTRKGWWSKVMS